MTPRPTTTPNTSIATSGATSPDVNAWFVLRRESADWDRLAAEGFRLVPFGSPEHVQLLLNTDHLISSQVDHYIVRPLD